MKMRIVLNYPMPYYLYILECQNNTLYIGYTTDIERRYREHLKGSPKCQYTRSFPPRRLLVCWSCEGSLSEVLKIEHKLKRLSRAQKLWLIANPKRLKTFLSLKHLTLKVHCGSVVASQST